MKSNWKYLVMGPLVLLLPFPVFARSAPLVEDIFYDLGFVRVIEHAIWFGWAALGLVCAGVVVGCISITKRIIQRSQSQSSQIQSWAMRLSVFFGYFSLASLLGFIPSILYFVQNPPSIGNGPLDPFYSRYVLWLGLISGILTTLIGLVAYVKEKERSISWNIVLGIIAVAASLFYFWARCACGIVTWIP